MEESEYTHARTHARTHICGRQQQREVRGSAIFAVRAPPLQQMKSIYQAQSCP